MRRILCFLLCCSVMLSFSTFAEMPTINFLGINWWSTLSDVYKELESKGIIKNGSYGQSKQSNLTKYQFCDTQDAKVENGAYSTYISDFTGIEIAGRSPEMIILYNIINLDSNGKPIEVPAESELYTVTLYYGSFDEAEFDEAASIVEDLVSGIAAIYGKPTRVSQFSENQTYYKWIDGEKNSIVIDYFHLNMSSIDVTYSTYVVDKAKSLSRSIDKYGITTPEPTAPATTSIPKPTNGTATPTNDKKYLINTNGVEMYLSDEYKIWGDGTYLSLGVIVENNSGNNISIRADSAAVNDWEVYGGMVGKVGPGKKLRDAFNIKIADADISTLGEIETIAMVYEVYDSNTYKTLFKTNEVTITFH